MKSVEGRLIRIFVENGLEPELIQRDAALPSMGLTSLIFIKMVVEIEHEFDIRFGHEDFIMEKYDTLDDLIIYTEEKYGVQIPSKFV